MIVKIAACLYILEAALGLWSLSLSPFGPGATMANLLVFAMSGLFAAMGAGLLKKASWARWMALGNSLLGWLVGTLVLLALIAVFFLANSLASGILAGLGAILGFVAALLALIFVVSIVINYKLYFYLRSEEGAAEFGVEVEPLGSVLGSVATWLVIGAVQSMFASAEIPAMIPSGGSDSNYEEQAQALHIEQKRELARQQQILEQQQAQLERERAAIEEQNARTLAQTPESSVAANAEEPAARYEPTVIESRPASEAPSKSGILKCRDEAGAVQYTQGYCPPGTKQVELSNY